MKQSAVKLKDLVKGDCFVFSQSVTHWVMVTGITEEGILVRSEHGTKVQTSNGGIIVHRVPKPVELPPLGNFPEDGEMLLVHRPPAREPDPAHANDYLRDRCWGYS